MGHVFVKTQISNALKADFLAAMAGEYEGTSDFFRRKIKEMCDVQKEDVPPKAVKKGFTSLSASVTPEQRAALLAQCEKEGVTMGTWMRRQILDYLAAKK